MDISKKIRATGGKDRPPMTLGLGSLLSKTLQILLAAGGDRSTRRGDLHEIHLLEVHLKVALETRLG